MKILLLTISLLLTNHLTAQDTLPAFKIINANGNIIISWNNDYAKQAAEIKIQRSYDSLKNYATVGAVLSATNTENGYVDRNPPYNKMYYRIFIAFEDGSYIITPARRPIKLPPPPPPPPVQIPTVQVPSMPISPEQPKTKQPNLKNDPPEQKTIPSAPQPNDSLTFTLKRLPWQADPLIDSSEVNFGELKILGKQAITYPSKRIYTNSNHLIVIHLPDAVIKNYSAKFFDENGKKIFEITRLKEEYLMLEKVNFMHSGWFTFELYRNGELVEKNKIFIPKDSKSANADSLRKPVN